MADLSIQQVVSPPVAHAVQTNIPPSSLKLNCLYAVMGVAVISVIAATIISIYVAENCTIQSGYFTSTEAQIIFTASLSIAGGGLLGIPYLSCLIEGERMNTRARSQTVSPAM